MSDQKHNWLDPLTVAVETGSIYPAPFDAPVAARAKGSLGDALDLTQFGVNLVTDAGERQLCSGMAVGFPAGRADGHHLVHKNNAPVLYLEVGTRAAGEVAEYSDIDMVARREGGTFCFTRKDGEPYP